MGRAQVDRQVLLCVARFRRGRQVARGEIFEKGTAPRSRSRAEIGSTAVQSQRRIPLSASLALCLPRRSGSFLPVRGPAVRRRSDQRAPMGRAIQRRRTRCFAGAKSAGQTRRRRYIQASKAALGAGCFAAGLRLGCGCLDRRTSVPASSIGAWGRTRSETEPAVVVEGVAIESAPLALRKRVVRIGPPILSL